MSTLAGKRIGWTLVGVIVAFLAGAAILTALNWSTETITEQPRGVLGALYLTCWGALFVTFALVGALIVSRQPGNAVGWIFSWYGVSGAAVTLAAEYVFYALLTAPGGWPAVAAAAWITSFVSEYVLFVQFSFTFLLIPNGRLLSNRWRVVAAAAITGGVLSVLGLFQSGQLAYYALEEDVEIRNPFGIEPLGTVIDVLSPIGLAISILMLGASIVSAFVRFRRSRGTERQQLKWFVLAALVVLSVWGLTLPVRFYVDVPDEVWNVLVLLGFFSIPIAAGIAIVRHNLYDIDIIINRALVYLILTASLALAYIAIVVLLGAGLRAASGQQSAIVTAASTLAVAGLFQPLRSRIQAFVDRRFYRQKYDAARTLEAFSTRLRDEIDLDTLSIELRAVVQQTMQPAHVWLWLRDSAKPPAAS